MPPEEQSASIDVRQYIGILFFRWQIIAVCFLYCLLAGVLYIQFAPRRYRSACKITLYQDPNLTLQAERNPFWTSFRLHEYMMTNPRLIDRVVNRLKDDWGEQFGSVNAMRLPVSVDMNRGVQRLITVSVISGDRDYATVFLNALIDEHQAEWENLQRLSRESAGSTLEVELARLELSIKESEDQLLEYQRLHDIARVEARSTMESRYLEALMERKNQIQTELMLLEAQYPALKDAGVGLVSHVGRLTRETGAIRAPNEDGTIASDRDDETARLPAALRDADTAAERPVDGWASLRVRLAQLEHRERGLAADLTAENPKLMEVRKDIEQVRSELALATEIELNQLRDRHRALTIQLNAIESAEYTWQSRNLLASQRRAEFNRIKGRQQRFEANYKTLYDRLHTMRMSEELKAEQFSISEPPTSEDKPIWPDPFKILLVALAAGLGSGFGIALLMQVTDNKIQSIRDVENDLKIPYLGGVPFWVHSGLETTIRPIVTEEHSAGAVEAYRALRTSIVAAMERMNEKVLMVTSADSREGKTLTSLNLAIMMAQMEKRVLLVDMDLRRGRIHRSLGADRSPGVTDALTRRVSLREFVSGTRIDGLDIVPTGSNNDAAAELLQTFGVRELLGDLTDDYDYIVMDTSPILRVTDTVILTGQGVGVVLYVARVNRTPIPLIRYSLNMLDQARVLGLVMNSIEMHKISSLYYTYQYPNYAYYSNAYAYGYNYYYYGDGHEKGRRRRSFHRRRREFTDWLRKTFLPVE